MASLARDKAEKIRDFIREQLGEWTDPNPEKDQDTIDDLTDAECAQLTAQLQEKSERPRRPIGVI